MTVLLDLKELFGKGRQRVLILSLLSLTLHLFQKLHLFSFKKNYKHNKVI